MEKTQYIERATISQAEFDKRVESEFCNLVYFDRLEKPEAWKKAVAVISSEYVVVNQRVS